MIVELIILGSRKGTKLLRFLWLDFSIAKLFCVPLLTVMSVEKKKSGSMSVIDFFFSGCLNVPISSFLIVEKLKWFDSIG